MNLFRNLRFIMDYVAPQRILHLRAFFLTSDTYLFQPINGNTAKSMDHSHTNTTMIFA